MWPTDAHELLSSERKKERKKETSRVVSERTMKKNEIRDARSGNGRLVVGGLHADVLVVFRQTWFFSSAVVGGVVEKRHDDDSFRTTTVR